jgi:hypothetical protein
MDVRHYTEVAIFSLVGPVLMPPLLLPAEARNSGDLLLVEAWSCLGVQLFSHIGSCEAIHHTFSSLHVRLLKKLSKISHGPTSISYRFGYSLSQSPL